MRDDGRFKEEHLRWSESYVPFSPIRFLSPTLACVRPEEEARDIKVLHSEGVRKLSIVKIQGCELTVVRG